MINWVLRAVIILWAAFFAIVAVQGIWDPAAFGETFGISVMGVAANTVRADLGSFFLVASCAAALGALVPGWSRALLVPGSLYGVALFVRMFGLARGDMWSTGITQAMIVEALTLALMVGSWWILSRPAPVVDIAHDDAGKSLGGSSFS